MTGTLFKFDATCAHCGGPLKQLAAGTVMDCGTFTQSSAKCVRNGCSRSWVLTVTMRPLKVEVTA